MSTGANRMDTDGVSLPSLRPQTGEDEMRKQMRSIVLGVFVALIVAAGATAALQKGGSLHATLKGKVEVPKGDPDGAARPR